MCIKYSTILLFFSLQIFGVTIGTAQEACSTPVYKAFDTGRAKVWHSTSGKFWKSPNGNGFEVMDDEFLDAPVQVANGAGFWIMGEDDGGNIKASLPAPIGNGWHPGPLNIMGESTPELCNNFNKIWEVTREDLNILAADLGDNGIVDGPIPHNILAWPGKNNPFFEEANGFELPATVEYASFFDYGSDGAPDGNYDPDKGDFPLISINHCNINFYQKIHWWVINDVGLNPQFSPEVAPIRMQVECTAFTYDKPSFDNSSIFYDFNFINRSVEPINNLKVGFWMDPSLGCPEDDFIGSNPELNLSYVYNGDGKDGMENCLCENEAMGFCEASPIFGVKVLRGPLNENFQEVGLSSIIYFDENESAIPITQSPNSLESFGNYLNGKWSDGSPFSPTANGLDPNSTNTTTFIFTENPANINGWSMCTVDIDPIAPIVLNTFEDFTLFPGARNLIQMQAMVTSFEEQTSCSTLTPLYEQIELIDKWRQCHEGYEPPCPYEPPPQEPEPEIDLEVYPNPASEFVIIQPGAAKVLKEVRLIDTAGRIINEFLNIQQEILRIEHPSLNGIYFLQLRMTDETTSLHKISFHT